MPIIPPRPHLTKIPGELPRSPREVYVEDFCKLTKVQLLEIKGRQEKLLANKSRISKLPDKGKRIQEFYDKILKELAHRDEVQMAANMFSELNIASNGQTKLNNLEWTGKCEFSRGEIILDSDDDEELDPLKIIAQSTNLEKKVKYIPPERSFITEEDLKEIESFQTDDKSKQPIVPAEIINIDISNKIDAIKSKLENKLNTTASLSNSRASSSSSIDIEPHALYVFEKAIDGSPLKEKFKPYKTTKTNVHDPEKEMLRKPWGKNWEVTAATPPPIRHAGAKVLPLQHSVELQVEYLARLQQLQEKQAEERLKAKAARQGSMGVPELAKLTKFFGTYRDVLDASSSDSEVDDEKIDSDEGVRDDEEDKGGVSFVVYK